GVGGQWDVVRGNECGEGRWGGSLISQGENHLARNPNDGTGWEVIAPVYFRLGRFSDAVMARKKAIALNGDSPARESDLGEALVAAADGVVTDEAKLSFQRAVAGDVHNPQARSFFCLAAARDGKPEEAPKETRPLPAEAPPAPT